MPQPEPGPASFAALRGAVLQGHEPPPLQAVARLAWYPWAVVGTVCIGAGLPFGTSTTTGRLGREREQVRQFAVISALELLMPAETGSVFRKEKSTPARGGSKFRATRRATVSDRRSARPR